MAEKDFFVDEFGQIHRNKVPNKGKEDLLAEYHQLEYEIFSHNDKTPEKLARFEELKKILGIDENSKKNAFLKAKQKILDSVGQQTMSVSQILAMGQDKQNE